MGSGSSKILCYYNGTNNEYYSRSTKNIINPDEIEPIILKEFNSLVLNRMTLTVELSVVNGYFFFREYVDKLDDNIISKIYFSPSSIEHLIHKILSSQNIADEYVLQKYRSGVGITYHILLNPKNYIISTKNQRQNIVKDISPKQLDMLKKK